MHALELAVGDLALTMLLGAGGILGAWLLRRHSHLSARNLYPPEAACGVLLVGVIAVHAWAGVLVLFPITTAWVPQPRRARVGALLISVLARSCATTNSLVGGSGSRRPSSRKASGSIFALRESLSVNGRGQARLITSR
jgi:hypothetical protein